MGRLSELRPVEAVLRRPHTLLEGPRLAADGSLLYSDVIAGGVYRHTPAGAIEAVLPGRRGVGGLVEHARGGVVATGRDLVHVAADGASERLLAREEITGFNDLTTMPDGRVIVGALRYRPLAGEPAVPGELLRVVASDRAELISETVLWPNGIGLDPGGERLYVSDFAREHVRAIAAGGEDEGVFCESPRGSADGLAVDADGGVWLALGHGGGVARFEPDGRLDEIVEVPAAFVSSISFGGADGRDAVISTADNRLVPDTGGALFLARSEVEGLPVAPASI